MRLLLRLYPASFRREFGDEMLQVFEDMRRARGRHALAAIALDVVASAPGRWMEEAVVRSRLAVAAFMLVGVLGGTILVTGGRMSRIGAAVALLILGAMGLVFALGSVLGRRGTEHDYGSRRARWWWLIAGAAGAVMAFMGVGQLVDDPKKENVFAMVLMLGFAALIFGGMRVANRRAGNWMIATGVLPLVPWVWMVAPPILALVVIVMALSDNVRMSHAQGTA